MTDEQLQRLFDTLSGELRRLAEENAAAHEETRSVLRAEIDETRTALRSEIDKTRSVLGAEIDETRSVLGAEIDETRTALRSEIDKTRSVLGAEIDETRNTLRLENAAAHEATRRHFDIMVESVRHDTQLVAENVLGMKEELVRLAEKLDQTSTDLQAMIKFSHSELDKRLRALEATH
jgi:hypothetical protein